MKDKFTIQPQDLQDWINDDKIPEGLEDFGELSSDGIDVNSGEFDSGKSSMVDFEIILYNEKVDECWIGKGGYYNWSCGYQFNQPIEFIKIEDKEDKHERLIDEAIQNIQGRLNMINEHLKHPISNGGKAEGWDEASKFYQEFLGKHLEKLKELK